MVAGDDSGGIPVDEQLNGLVTLLQSVGIDGVESSVLVEEQKRLSKRNPKRKGAHTSKNAVANNVNATTTTSDAQILQIIKKLQQAQADSPEILEALKNPQLLALATLAAQKQTIQGQGRLPTRGQTKPKKSGAPSLGDVIDDDDDHYPKIGPGYSDEVSCISDISTPTVMTYQKVADEENYREVKGGPGALPPMHTMLGTPGGPVAGGRATRVSRAIGRIGLGAPTAAGKTKNMVGQVRPLPSRRLVPTKTGSGGAAAQRRLNYQMAMSKLESIGFGKQPAAPTDSHSPPESPESSSNNDISRDKKTKKTSGKTSIGSGSNGSGGGGSGNGNGNGRRKTSAVNKKNKINKEDIDWGMTDEKGWPTLKEDADKTSKTTPDLVVDDNGFLSENAFSPTVKSKKTHRRKRSEKPSGARSSESSEKPSISRSSEHSEKPSGARSSESSEKPPSGRSSESSGSKSKKKSSREDKEDSSGKERSSSKTKRNKHRVKKHKEKDGHHEHRSSDRLRRRRSKSTGKSPPRRSSRRPSLTT